MDTMRTVEYSLVHVRATPENVDDALQTIAADWSGEVIKPRTHLGELWSTVLVTERTAATVAPLLGEFLAAPVLAVNVAGERFSMSYWRAGGAQPVRVDGYNDGAAAELAGAFSKDPDSLRTIMRSSKPAAERHAEAAEQLRLPLPVLTGYEPVFDGRQTVQPSELPKLSSRFRRRRRLRRVGGILGLLEIVAFLVVDYFWFIKPSIWVVPALAFFVVNGIVLLVLWRRLRHRPVPQPSNQP